MSYRIENQDIIIDGFEKGIGDSPYSGHGDMRNLNLISYPGEASVNYGVSAMTVPPTVSAVAFTVGTNDIFTVVNTTGFYNGLAITLNSLVDGTGLATGRVYWIGDITPTTFKVYSHPAITGTAIDVTLAGSGTFSTYVLGQIIDKAVDWTGGNVQDRNLQFFLDSNGLVWWVYNFGGTPTNNLVYLGNDTLTSTGSRGLNVLDSFLVVFRSGNIDYLPTVRVEGTTDLDTASGWVYGWKTATNAFRDVRPTLVGQDNALYYSNGINRLGSIVVVGPQFDPTDAAKYTLSIEALTLPAGDTCTALGELGTKLLIGARKNWVYPWDRISTSFSMPLILSENLTTKIVTANNTAYIFAGNRGRIYLSNGTNVTLVKKIPDSITNVIDPYFTWNDAVYWKNQIYFSFNAFNNAGTALTDTAGVWAIDLDSQAIRLTNQLSYGAYTGTASVIAQNVISNTPGGAGLFIGWISPTATYGMDATTTTPYSSYAALGTIVTNGVDTDIIPVGTYLSRKTFYKVEFKLSAPMTSGDGIRISVRNSLSASFALVEEILYSATNDNNLSYASNLNAELFQWIQLRVEIKSGGSFTRLREIRISSSAQ